MLRATFVLIAQHLQESADMAHSNVRSMLSDAVSDAHRGSGKWASYADHTGDGESGDCIYHCDGGMKSAPYEITKVGDKTAANLDTANAKKVQPVVSYAEQADDDDYYSTMEESLKKSNLQSGLEIYERFISKGERDKASDDDFAGKGRSFPILKPGDVSAAVHAMGRAGSGNLGMSALKARIVAIANKKGWTSELPKAWRGTTDAKEAARGTAGSDKVALIESAGCEFLQPISLAEGARVNYPIKIISPGTGSTAHYPADVLERDGPKVFKKGTLMFWNHPTAQESAHRPEGDLNNLAAITTQDAVYRADGPKGPGLYAEAKVMADYAEKVAERAPHIGLSIRAGGSGDGSKINGKPVLKSIDYVESVDYVTKAGRGGLALAEAARDAGILSQENEMTLQEAQDMAKKEVQAALAPYRNEQLRESAKREGKAVLESVSWPKSAKKKVIAVCLESIPTKADGSLDVEKFRAKVVQEAKEFGEVLREATGSGNVTGMGADSPFAVPLSEAQRADQRLREEREEKEYAKVQEGAVDIFAALTGDRNVAKAAVLKGRAA